MVSAEEILNARILIVDDQQANVELLEQMLLEIGYQSITSTMDPHTVRPLHAANHYDLILLDLQIPEMDGFQIMESLKEIETDGYIPILVITAQPDHKLRALAAGAKDFVAKPFDLIEVQTRIRNMLEVRLLYKQLERANKVLESFAMHDALTGLPNRRLLMDRLSLAIAHTRRTKRTMGVMFLDLDGFKQINDTLGHDVGDILLQMVAERTGRRSTSRRIQVARLGGDEFVIGLWEIGHVDGVTKLAAKVIQAVAQPYSNQGHNVKVTAQHRCRYLPPRMERSR